VRYLMTGKDGDQPEQVELEIIRICISSPRIRS
jgi:hypothetical protein